MLIVFHLYLKKAIETIDRLEVWQVVMKSDNASKIVKFAANSLEFQALMEGIGAKYIAKVKRRRAYNGQR